ncbi:MAG TPA: hypothetical protein VFC46_13760, partial [Humisphaera sp.]|nr:hypothetical protein [Humisphaera sp.]
MFFFRRRSATASNSTSNRPASIEGLEDRRLLSAAALHADIAGHSTPGVHSHVSHLHVGGTVVGTTTNSITISTGGAAGSTSQATYNVDPAAAITANGTAVTLDKLVAGVKVVLTTSSTDPTTVTAIKAIATKVTGVVTAVDTTGNTISLAARRGATPTTYAIPAGTAITVNHAAGALSDITVGSIVHLQFSALSGTTVASVASHTKPSGGIGKNSTPATGGTSASTNTGASSANTGSSTTTGSTGTSTGTTSTGDSSGGTDSDPNPATSPCGTLVSVDTTADTITISTAADDGAAATSTTYTLDPAVTITADGAASTLGALAIGDSIALTLNTATPAAVTAIVATGSKVEGSVTAVDTTAGTITLTPENGGAAATYTIPSAATITVDGAAGTLAGIAVGMSVKIQLSALDNT